MNSYCPSCLSASLAELEPDRLALSASYGSSSQKNYEKDLKKYEKALSRAYRKAEDNLYENISYFLDINGLHISYNALCNKDNFEVPYNDLTGSII